MAPNRKQLTLLTESLADLDLVQPKYLPLTSEVQQQTSVKPVVAIQPQTAPSDDYWTWTSEDVVVEEEPTKDLFSCSSIEQNLIKDAENRATTSNVIKSETTVEGYWDEATSSTTEEDIITTTTKPQHDNYWAWPVNEKEARIAAILADEVARTKMSTDKIISNLRQVPQKAVREMIAANDQYWDWESPSGLIISDALDEVYSNSYWEWSADERSEVNNKVAFLANILQYEANRQLLSTDRIEANLQKAPATSCQVQAATATNDDYWSWSTPATSTSQDNYWDWNAKPAVEASGKSYWDW